MMHIVSINEAGLITRGYHRVIHGVSREELHRLFDRINEICVVESASADRNEFAVDPQEMLKAVGKRDSGDFVFGIHGQNGGFQIARMPAEGNDGVALRCGCCRAF